MVIKNSKESSEDPANGGCGDKNLTGVSFMNSARVHGVVFRKWEVRVGGGGQGSGGSGKSLIGKRFSIVCNIIKNGLIEVA